MHDRSPIQAHQTFFHLRRPFAAGPRPHCATQVVALNSTRRLNVKLVVELEPELESSALREIYLKQTLFVKSPPRPNPRSGRWEGGIDVHSKNPAIFPLKWLGLYTTTYQRIVKSLHTFSHGLCLQGFPLLFVFISRITIFGSHGFGYILRY